MVHGIPFVDLDLTYFSFSWKSWLPIFWLGSVRGQQSSPHLSVLGWDSSAVCFPCVPSQPYHRLMVPGRPWDVAPAPLPRAGRDGRSHPEHLAPRAEEVKNLLCLLPSATPASGEPDLTFSQGMENSKASGVQEYFQLELLWF